MLRLNVFLDRIAQVEGAIAELESKGVVPGRELLRRIQQFVQRFDEERSIESEARAIDGLVREAGVAVSEAQDMSEDIAEAMLQLVQDITRTTDDVRIVLEARRTVDGYLTQGDEASDDVGVELSELVVVDG